jgi:hypothetical protein
MFAEYWNIMKGRISVTLKESLQNGDVLGEALNNFQTMTLHHLIQRLCPGKKSKV